MGGDRSLYVTRPSLHAYIHSRQELETCSAALFEGLAKGWLKVPKPKTFALKDAASAQRLLESRKSTGPMVLVVDAELGATAGPHEGKAAPAKKTKAAPAKKKGKK